MTSRRLIDELSCNGILLLSDPHLPSAVKIVGGPRAKGSWWSAKKARVIFKELESLSSEPDVLTTRLVSGKVTFLHRRLWGHFLAVCTSRAPWQMSGLTAGARKLLRKIDDEGEVRADGLGPRGRTASRLLEQRLLVYTDEVHTEKGYHTRVLSVWSRCPKLEGFKSTGSDPASGMQALDEVLEALNSETGGKGTLPWWRQGYLKAK